MTQKTVVIGVTGGIAAYKALDVISSLKKENVNVHVIMTSNAAKFVSPLSFQTLSQNFVITDMFAEPRTIEVEHISLAKKADLFAVIPATANIIGKVACGIADDMLTTTIMATKSPVLFAPAMNTNMYNNPIVKENILKLKKIGYDFIEPDSGRLACGDIGIGKLADTNKITDIINMYLYSPKDFLGKNVLVTAGPTREDIDPVRFITNKSSGKMGYALARALRDRGANVTLISGPSNLEPPERINFIKVYSAEDMFNQVMEHFDENEIIIKSAAVADYSPENVSSIKIKKSDNDLSIKLKRNRDILYELGRRKKNQILVGFAAETNDMIQNAQEKIKKKNLDMIVANDVTVKGSGFQCDTNTVKIIKSNGDIVSLPNMTKYEAAHKILDNIIDLER
ncbi:MAG TPA: bifunctional phosphopantothenoylcysteine decarboxylase/phosphopantothenate--cysteine ligase CoaBC [Clostridiaceae bacterium]|jgi:phosphopantothenoylcysteine decarboxylase/phosphopantothenate--cysteine ligase|nr:bifunctional phosphopantothenoylcysteine decarboxylase/phosphopantothenate--cysteine ligase CoaBC [Clostridiaceae bacterium]HBF78000.1 bifunctional phosphopantothenoylcysteine decarboxylase/phosphopantothenate--cysteine ligase CoaBC [Clostridiaceae bacterium]HBG37958.1 bifunctional phosphopantothenoylcysteine decarboxylase/phosphopantothenate--cysteine ligase CoaBC [Clostridiaceae bacterium]HBN27456.1 bifunctional phosphopantothenoylcysteine decarboxylase/phosphopantothenate--cysteine ligase 